MNIVNNIDVVLLYVLTIASSKFNVVIGRMIGTPRHGN